MANTVTMNGVKVTREELEAKLLELDQKLQSGDLICSDLFQLHYFLMLDCDVVVEALNLAQHSHGMVCVTLRKGDDDTYRCSDVSWEDGSLSRDGYHKLEQGKWIKLGGKA